jgi:signal transduction histidine kinase
MTSKPHIQLEALHSLARALSEGEFRARTVLEGACSAVAGGFGFERVGIVRYVEDGGTLIPFAAHGLTDEDMAALPSSLPIAVVSAFREAFQTGLPVFVADPSDGEALPAANAYRFGIGSFVIVPLVSEGRCLGFLTCDQRGESFWIDSGETDLLGTCGALIAAFLGRAIQHAELRRLNELKSEFAALASHELRTPAAVIYGAVETLDEREAELTPEQRADVRRVLTLQAKRLYELVDHLLDLSRLEAGALRIEPVEVDVRARLEDIVEILFDDGGAVSIEVPDGLRAIVDPRAFDRIVANLLVNAARHGEPPVVVAAGRTGSDLTVTVEDRGPGIAPDYRMRVFDRFTRGETPATEGAGLGLAIAQSYARAHGGSLTYEPAEPNGARFRLTFPG